MKPRSFETKMSHSALNPYLKLTIPIICHFREQLSNDKLENMFDWVVFLHQDYFGCEFPSSIMSRSTYPSTNWQIIGKHANCQDCRTGKKHQSYAKLYWVSFHMWLNASRMPEFPSSVTAASTSPTTWQIICKHGNC